MTFLDWLATVNWAAAVERFILPALAIVISALIAVGLARRERRDALADRKKERRLEAGAGVIIAIAPLASFTDLTEPVQRYLWEFRARTAVYRAWIEKDDRSGDWLALRHREGMRLWSRAVLAVDALGGPSKIGVDDLLAALEPAHQWGAASTEMFTGWLSGHVETEVLLRDGARIMQEWPQPSDSAQS